MAAPTGACNPRDCPHTRQVAKTWILPLWTKDDTLTIEVIDDKPGVKKVGQN